jgi:DNA-directed RNA polymerase specialized sigma24 family protein
MPQYIANKDLEAIWERWMAGEEAAKNELADALYLIVRNIFKRWRFSIIPHADLVQECVIDCYGKLIHFQKGRGRIFNFVTTIVINQARHIWRGEKNYEEFKDRLRAKELREGYKL